MVHVGASGNSYASQPPQQQYTGFPFAAAAGTPATAGPAAPFGALERSSPAADPSAAAAALFDMALNSSASAPAPEHASDPPRGRDKELIYSYASLLLLHSYSYTPTCCAFVFDSVASHSSLRMAAFRTKADRRGKAFH